MDDVHFLGGHGSGGNPPANAIPDSDLPGADGGIPASGLPMEGRAFTDIWTPNTFAQSGFLVSNTKTPGHVYELSNEHHVRNEIKFIT